MNFRADSLKVSNTKKLKIGTNFQCAIKKNK